MDAGIIRGIGTLLLFVAFLLYCAWAWRPEQRRRFEEAELLPFLDDASELSAAMKARGKRTGTGTGCAGAGPERKAR